jgi:hypothetical protein
LIFDEETEEDEMPPLMAANLFFIAALSISAAPPQGDKKVDFQKLADETNWEWARKKAVLTYCQKRYKGEYKLEVTATDEYPMGNSLVSFKDKMGREAFSFAGHYWTVFVEEKNVVYYADFDPIATGCTIIAHDLKANKGLWKTKLKGLGPTVHSKYSNAVVLDIKDGALRVLGHEDNGNYVEFVDMKTGKTVGHRVFEDKK